MLDTSAVSGFFRGDGDIVRMVRAADDLYVSTVVIGELLAGFAMGKSEKKNKDLLDRFLSSPRVGIAGIDAETPERYAAVVRHLRESGTPIPTNDVWIAASAMQHGLKLLTTDRHFMDVPQILTIYPGGK